MASLVGMTTFEIVAKVRK